MISIKKTKAIKNRMNCSLEYWVNYGCVLDICISVMRYVILFMCYIFISSCTDSNRTNHDILLDQQKGYRSNKSNSKLISCDLPIYSINDNNISKNFMSMDSAEYYNLIRDIKFLPEYSRFEYFYKSSSFGCGNLQIELVLHKDESCCTSLYYISYSKLEHRFINCKLVALVGSDANWSEEDIIKSNGRGSIQTFKLISDGIEDEATGNVKGYVKDSIIVKYSFYTNGEIRKSVIDSVRAFTTVK